MEMWAIEQYMYKKNIDDGSENKIFLAIKSWADVVLDRYISWDIDWIVNNIVYSIKNGKNNTHIRSHIDDSVEKILELRVKIWDMIKRYGKYYYISNL
jgi:hypothetical protein